MKKILLFLLIFPTLILFPQHPKREFRAAWIATVANLDWPTSNHLTVEQQKSSLIKLLDQLKAAGINAVVFQVRSECDAMYASNYEPWSYWLTGIQGKAPSPYYDPLEFAIKEAHKRGMELHAWFNPYRAERSVGRYSLAPNHPAVKHPEWIIRIGNLKILDPGIPAVREYVKDVIMDVVNRYDVDGVHFDDYFYPYPPNNITSEDNSTFNTYPNGFTNIDDWRRNNVNLLIKMVHEAIDSVKPWVKFGISPFGIWRPGNPPGIIGMDAYSEIYCDPLAWLKAKTVDYLSPQLYWKIGGNQDYSKLLPWWGSKINGRHLYPGQALYRVSQSGWSSAEIPNQIKINRSVPQCEGSIFFRALNVPENPRGVTDSLKNYYYRYPSLMPVMSWKDSIPPEAPQMLAFKRIPGKAVSGLVWDKPPEAADGDTAYHYVVYNFYTSGMGPVDFESGENINAITVTNSYVPARSTGEAPRYFAVSALDRINNESEPTDVIEIPQPATPALLSPADGKDNLPDSVVLAWQFTDNASFYDLEISKSATFDTLDFYFENIQDTTFTLTGMEGQTRYYWRLQAANVAGESGYSDVFSFTTGFPQIPTAVYPADLMLDVPFDLTFEWTAPKGAKTYAFQLSKSLNFAASEMVVDTSGLTDTSIAVSGLEKSKIYFWRVEARNDFGSSGWSPVFKFRTKTTSAVSEGKFEPKGFKLYQNFPNPFNPVTNIRFEIPKEGFVSLKVYDILGRLVADLVNKNLPAGTYNFEFNGTNLDSGIYIYVLSFNQTRLIGKMILLK